LHDGWGEAGAPPVALTVTPLPFSHLVPRIVFDAALAIWVLLELRVRLRSRFNPRGAKADRGSVLVVGALFYAGVAAAFVLARRVQSAAIPDARWVLFVAGLVVMSAGVALRQWAVHLLGRFFTVDVRVHPDQTVVDIGPYRWVRHPSYLGLVLTFVGIGLALGNWVSLVVLAVVPTIGLVVRIEIEERALLAGLGEPYRRFAATRARLIPGVW
jgi:protein-S-isoprenylcysteine O-methyltransferase Ste14